MITVTRNDEDGFKWEINIEALDYALKEAKPTFDAMCAKLGLTQQGLEENAVRWFIEGGLYPGGIFRSLQSLLITNFLVEQKTSNPRQPGRYKSYIDDCDFEFNISQSETNLYINAIAWPHPRYPA